LSLALAAVAVVSGALVVTGTAQSMLSIFEPKQFVPVPVQPASFASLPDLAAYGTMHISREPVIHQPESAASASSAAGLHVLVPGFMPPGVSGPLAIHLVTEASGSFTFSSAKARATAHAEGRSLPSLPSDLDGTTLYLTAGPGVVETIGTQSPAERAGRSPSAPGNVTQLFGGIPQVLIVEMHTPKVTSTGASVSELEGWLVSLPGVSPELKAQIRAIGNPENTLPVPIPTNAATAQHVPVQGVSGLLVGDRTGVGSGLLWEKDGIVYGVAGTLSADYVRALADSLH